VAYPLIVSEQAPFTPIQGESGSISSLAHIKQIDTACFHLNYALIVSRKTYPPLALPFKMPKGKERLKLQLSRLAE